MTFDEMQELYRKVKTDLANELKSKPAEIIPQENKSQVHQVISRPIPQSYHVQSRSCCGRARKP
jgi:hypothetical protein